MGKIILNGKEYAGSGGSGGHTIVDPDGTSMPQENKLQFTGAVSVSDDSANGQTVVDIEGGAVYGAFLNPDRMIYSAFTYDEEPHDWVAPEDCILTDNLLPPNQNKACFLQIDGKQVQASYSTIDNPFVYVRKGQTVTYRAKSGSAMKAYGLIQGTNEIFAPVIYSTEEREIGCWTDGKPLYQKTWFVPKSSLNSGETTYTHGDDLHIDNLVSVEGAVGNSRPLVEYHSSSAWACSIYNIGNNAFWIYLGSSVYSNMSASSYVKVTLRYTKTTDTAGSGSWNTDGVPTHHYSTNEQVIGTWIDGKPLYQRTWDFGSNITINSNAWTNTTINVAGNSIKAIINSKATNDGGTNFNFIACNVDQTYVQVLQTRNVAIVVRYLTLEYTKTTD